ncbi:MAG: hypothetical protein ACJZ82_01700, partial [Paracoccaceae bacterium]
DGHEDDILSSLAPFLRGDQFRSMLVEVNNKKNLKKLEEDLLQIGVVRDLRYEDLKNHSRFRRSAKGSNAQNVIFKKK